MSSSKGSSSKDAAARPPVYRDDPDERAETSSMSSAVYLDHIDDAESFPDDELPAYTDSLSSSMIKPPQAIRPPQPRAFEPVPALPFSTSDFSNSEIRTRFPYYTTNTEALLSMVHDQADFPPRYFVDITGMHTETSGSGKKETKNDVTDFSLTIDLTNLLTRGPRQGGYIELLPDNKRGYRGGIVPRLVPTMGAQNVEGQVDDIRNWCEHYVQNPAKIKTFTLKREIRNHDTAKLAQLIRSAIKETNYWGRIQVNFRTTHNSVVVYSPGVVNDWRTTTWVRWVFYLSFLWVITWPLLFLFTRKYEVVKAVYPYADVIADEGAGRSCTVMSEVEWYQKWESAIKRAALARMLCKDRCLDEEYRRASVEAETRRQRGAMQSREVPSPGSGFADRALGVFGDGLRMAGSIRDGMPWGADC